VFDPSHPWWLENNYAPVFDERSLTNLPVEGSIPPELDGLYVRNGSNPKSGRSAHWFLGDGMVHGVRIQNGQALWYRNRYVQTSILGSAPPDGGPVKVPTLPDNASNVSVIHHGGRLLTSGEIGFPYELSPDDLSTKGVFDYAGALTTAMTAHPKIDPATGEMLMFGYWFAPPYLTFHQVDRTGTLTRSVPITLPSASMMHDFQVTASRVVFMDLPIILDLQMAAAGNPFPFRWDASHGARFGVMPRSGTDADVRWFDIDLCFVFHTLNAYDDGDRIVLECARHPELWVDGANDFRSRPTLHRYVIDPGAGTVSDEAVDDRLVEFPQFDRRMQGQKHRYGYGLWLKDPADGEWPAGTRGVLKYDRQTGTSTAHEFSAAEQPDEAFFVPASPGAAEDEGCLMTYVYDRARDRTDLVILDASRIEAAPLARIELPFRVPYGFHGLWVPA
jgi:carotenoid cleavage dioxygenase